MDTKTRHFLVAFACLASVLMYQNCSLQAIPGDAGNGGLSSSGTPGPSVVLSSDTASPTGLSIFHVTATFSETVSGFALSNVSVTNGVASLLSGSGSSYTFTVTAAAPGTVTVQALAGAATDGSGNPSTLSNLLNVVFDVTPPPLPVINSMTAISVLPLATAPKSGQKFELTPVLLQIPGNPQSSIYVPTEWDFLCNLPGNPLTAGSNIQLTPSDCNYVALPEISYNNGLPLGPGVYQSPSSGTNNSGAVPAGPNQWKLNYDGVNGAAITQDQNGNNYILTINHNETKDYRVKSANDPDGYKNDGTFYYYLSPFVAPVAGLPSQCGIGAVDPDGNGFTGFAWDPNGDPPGNTFETCYSSYGGFISIEVNSLTDASGTNPVGQNFSAVNDAAFGPVIWPSFGYYSADLTTQLSIGLRSVGSILSNGYLYIFPEDTSGNANNGVIPPPQGVAWTGAPLGSNGTKAARALIGPDGMPGPFMSYNVYTNAFDTPSLPEGFDKYNIAKFISVPGPQVPGLFSNDPGAQGNTNYSLHTNRFSVGYDATQNIYIGVEEYVTSLGKGNGSTTNLALRSSYDLVHWSARQPLLINGAPITSMHYPTLASPAFDSNTQVDLNNLYILGTDNSNSVNVMSLSVSIPSDP